jgi:hypothetical protein
MFLSLLFAMLLLSNSGFSQLDLGATMSTHETADLFCLSDSDETQVFYIFDTKNKKIWQTSIHHTQDGIGIDFNILDWEQLDCKNQPCFSVKSVVSPFHMVTKVEFNVSGETAHVRTESIYRNRVKIHEEVISCSKSLESL